MKPIKLAKKASRIADREDKIWYWHAPAITIYMEQISKSLSILISSTQSNEITDEELIKTNSAIEVLTEYIDKVLADTRYKKYHNFVRKNILPEAIKLIEDVNNKKISDYSPIVNRAKQFISDMKDIESNLDSIYHDIEAIIRKNSEAVNINARVEGDHWGLVASYNQIKKIYDNIPKLDTIDKFKEELKEIQQEAKEYYKEVCKKIKRQQAELEKLDDEINPDYPLFTCKYSEKFIHTEEDEFEVEIQ